MCAFEAKAGIEPSRVGSSSRRARAAGAPQTRGGAPSSTRANAHRRSTARRGACLLLQAGRQSLSSRLGVASLGFLKRPRTTQLPGAQEPTTGPSAPALAARGLKGGLTRRVSPRAAPPRVAGGRLCPHAMPTSRDVGACLPSRMPPTPPPTLRARPQSGATTPSSLARPIERSAAARGQHHAACYTLRCPALLAARPSRQQRRRPRHALRARRGGALPTPPQRVVTHHRCR